MTNSLTFCIVTYRFIQVRTFTIFFWKGVEMKKKIMLMVTTTLLVVLTTGCQNSDCIPRSFNLAVFCVDPDALETMQNILEMQEKASEGRSVLEIDKEKAFLMAVSPKKIKKARLGIPLPITKKGAEEAEKNYYRQILFSVMAREHVLPSRN